MPKPPPRPFFRTSEKRWYVKFDGKSKCLGKDRDEAFEMYFALMANRKPVTAETTVQELLGKFLSWCELHRDPLTYQWYRDRLCSFQGHIGTTLKLSALKPHHITAWLDSQFTGKSSTYRHGLVRAVVRAFNWASKEGHIADNPIRGVERPAYEPREVYVTPQQWERVLAKVKETDPFRDFLLILRATGCRPQEARKVEARHFDRDSETWTFTVKESKGKKHKRIVPLNNEALAITRRLAMKHPEGKLFRNEDGNPWSKSGINSRFTRLRAKLGFDFFAYAIRHTFVTDALLRGVDPVTLAHIVGHRDATMILRVYQHLNLNKGHIRQALALATGEVPARKTGAG